MIDSRKDEGQALHRHPPNELQIVRVGRSGGFLSVWGKDLVISVNARPHVNQEFDAAAKKLNLT